MNVREAHAGDAAAMSAVLREIVEATGHERQCDPAFVTETYIRHSEGVRCTVAVGEDEAVIGFQSLVRAWPDNPYSVPPAWGIIGTHISPRAQRRGVRRALFAASRAAESLCDAR